MKEENKKIVIGVTGSKGGGKGTISRYIAKEYGASPHRFSRPLDAILDLLDLPISRDNEIKIGMVLRNTFGGKILGNALKKMIKNDPGSLVVIDGIRFWDEVNILKTLPNFTLLYITAPLEVRHQRTKQRGTKAGEAETTLEEFAKGEQDETEIYIKEIGATADYSLDNNGTVEELYKKIDTIMKELGIHGSQN